MDMASVCKSGQIFRKRLEMEHLIAEQEVVEHKRQAASDPPPEETIPDINVGTHFFKQRYLFAFATQGEVINHLRTQTLSEEVNRTTDILLKWQEQRPKVQQFELTERGIADSSSLEDLPLDFSATLQGIADHALFRKTFMHLPFSFALVEIDKLVAPQRSVNLDYVERLQVAFRDKTSLSELISICLSPVREMPPIQHLEVANNTHMFSSPNTDLRFLGAFFKKLRPEDLQFAELGGIPAAAIITFIGYGGAPVNVFRWENRLVLNNGFHRLFALRSLGVTSVPVVVQHVQNIQLEFPSIVGGLPREYLLGVARPVLMKDFFEDGLCVTLNAKRRVRGISVQAAVGQFDVPS
jgi:hypothetical protein